MLRNRRLVPLLVFAEFSAKLFVDFAHNFGIGAVVGGTLMEMRFYGPKPWWNFATQAAMNAGAAVATIAGAELRCCLGSIYPSVTSC